MTLTFSKQGEKWVATATITAATPLHVELAKAGNFSIGEKSSSSASVKYAWVKDNKFERCSVIDADLVSATYPKYVQFTSTEEVLKATLG